MRDLDAGDFSREADPAELQALERAGEPEPPPAEANDRRGLREALVIPRLSTRRDNLAPPPRKGRGATINPGNRF